MQALRLFGHSPHWAEPSGRAGLSCRLCVPATALLPAAQWWESLYLLLFSLCCQGLIWQLVLLEARVSLLAVPSDATEVRRLYKQETAVVTVTPG